MKAALSFHQSRSRPTLIHQPFICKIKSGTNIFQSFFLAEMLDIDGECLRYTLRYTRKYFMYFHQAFCKKQQHWVSHMSEKTFRFLNVKLSILPLSLKFIHLSCAERGTRSAVAEGLRCSAAPPLRAGNLIGVRYKNNSCTQ